MANRRQFDRLDPVSVLSDKVGYFAHISSRIFRP